MAVGTLGEYYEPQEPILSLEMGKLYKPRTRAEEDREDRRKVRRVCI